MSPAKARRPHTRSISNAARKAILEAAEWEFGNYGLAGARTERIAARAGVNKALPFYHFGPKRELYGEVIRQALQKLGELIMQAYGTQQIPRYRAEALLTAFEQHLIENPNWARLVFRELLEGGPELRQFAGVYLAPIVEFVCGEVRRNMQAGLIRAFDPLQVLISLLSEAVIYILLTPVLEGLGLEAPLSAQTQELHHAAMREVLQSSFRGPLVPPDLR